MTQKKTAKAFLELVGTGKVDEAYERFVSDSFIHHNQYFKGDRESLKLAMTEAHQTNPNISIDIKSCYKDGPIVITHSLVTKKDMSIAVVHIFHFSDGKIEELWDLGQVIEKDSPNIHGLF